MDTVRSFLAMGISPNEVVEFGGTSLSHAAVNGHVAVLEVRHSSATLNCDLSPGAGEVDDLPYTSTTWRRLLGKPGATRISIVFI